MTLKPSCLPYPQTNNHSLKTRISTANVVPAKRVSSNICIRRIRVKSLESTKCISPITYGMRINGSNIEPVVLYSNSSKSMGGSCSSTKRLNSNDCVNRCIQRQIGKVVTPYLDILNVVDEHQTNDVAYSRKTILIDV